MNATICDACPARAKVEVVLIPSMGRLTLCGHHARAVTDGLVKAGAEFETVETEAVEV